MKKTVYVLEGDILEWDYAVFGVFSSFENALKAGRSVWSYWVKNDPEWKEAIASAVDNGWTGLLICEVPIDTVQPLGYTFAFDQMNHYTVDHRIYLKDVEK